MGKNHEKLCNNLREIRKSRGLTQQQLSESADVSRKSINAVENGVYIPSFNKKINYIQSYSLPENFEIIGSAHNTFEINLKLKQKCSEIFLSPVFKVNKSKKFLGVTKFNFINLNTTINCIALGGINEKNYKKINLLRSGGFASISWAKKNGLSKLRPL